MSLFKYQILCAAVELESLTKAGEHLNITQSAVSHAISSLEREFGVTLLARNRTAVRLTADGERMIRLMREMLQLNEQLHQEVAAIKGIERGTVRLGTFTSVSIQWLPGILKQFHSQYPLIEISLQDGSYQEIEDSLANGGSDIGFVNLPAAEGLETIALHKDRMVCVLEAGHPLSQLTEMEIGQLKDEPFIMPAEGCDNDVRRICAESRFAPNIRYQLEDDQAILAMVRNGLGVSILPEMIVAGQSEGICARPLAGGHYRAIGLAAKSFEKCSPAAKKLIDYVTGWVHQTYQGGSHA